MSYPRGYKLYEPKDRFNPNPQVDYLIVTLTEGVDYTSTDTLINFIETDKNSIYLNGGQTEYRYFIAFDDENTSQPSNIFSMINLMPPNNISLQTPEYDTIKVNYTNVEYATNYIYSLKDLTNNSTHINTIPIDSLILNLNPSTSYELKFASVNNKSEQSEWTTTYQITTLKLFKLNAVVGNQKISFSWDFTKDSNTNYFELINKDTQQVIYRGINQSYSIDSLPTQTLDTFVRLYNIDGSTRDTRLITSEIYTNYTIDLQYEIIVYSHDNKFNAKLTWQIDSDLTTLSKFKWTISNKDSFDSSTKTKIDNTLIDCGELQLNISNHLLDKYVFYQASTIIQMFKAIATTVSYQSFKYTMQYHWTVINNVNIPLQYGIIIHKDFDIIQHTSIEVYLSLDYNFLSNNLTFNEYKDRLRPTYDVRNNGITVDGFRQGLFNDWTRGLSFVRQSISSPTLSYNIDSVDTIYTDVTVDIDIRSEINPVRILCVGDSITAGAPLYDPQYGGTVWENDLITGKTKTRNVKESQYPYWLQVRLGIDDFQVVNEGSGRRTTSDVLYHIQDQIDEYHPQFAIIMIGTNDIFSAQDSGVANLQNTVNTALFNIRQTINIIKNGNAQPILGTQLPRNSIVPPEAKDALRNLNTGIKALGIEYGIDVIDWYDVFVQHDSNGNENGVLRYDLTCDDTHPTIEGYKTMAYTINLGIFNSFRTTIRLFGKMKLTDVDYSTEETKTQPDPYSYNYQINFDNVRRLQTYVFTKYLKNTGNSSGLFILQLNDKDNIANVWDDKNQNWTKSFVGELPPNQIMPLKMKFDLPATGRMKSVDFDIDYIVKR